VGHDEAADDRAERTRQFTRRALLQAGLAVPAAYALGRQLPGVGPQLHASQTHTDTPHQDTPHLDSHGDAGHSDVTFADMHADATPHLDVPSTHLDHTDAALGHADSNIADMPHLDHTDAVHIDTSVGHVDGPGPHTDTHTDTPHGDTNHTDVAHLDTAHADTPHGDSTGAHTDAPHADHTDSGAASATQVSSRFTG